MSKLKKHIVIDKIDKKANIFALYEIRKDSLYLSELYMYGSQRLGYLKENTFMGKLCKNKYCAGVNPVPFLGSATSTNKTLPIPLPNVVLPNYSTYTPLYFGNKRYELNDWLGNVRVVINDRKTPVNTGSVTISYKPQVVSVTDYYSYGMEIAERTHSFNTYRFSFNGKEDIREHRFMQDYGARWYNKALCRFISADPLIVNEKKYAWLSGYQFAGNKPIKYVDLDGLEELDAGYKAYAAGLSLLNSNAAKIEKQVNEQYWKSGNMATALVEHFVESPVNKVSVVFSTYFSTLMRGITYQFTGKDVGTTTYSFTLKGGFQKLEPDIKEYAKSLLGIYSGKVIDNVGIKNDIVKRIINYSVDEAIDKALNIDKGIGTDKNNKIENKGAISFPDNGKDSNNQFDKKYDKDSKKDNSSGNNKSESGKETGFIIFEDKQFKCKQYRSTSFIVFKIIWQHIIKPLVDRLVDWLSDIFRKR